MSSAGPNDTRRPDLRKDLCEDLARHLETPEAQRAAELLRRLESGDPSAASWLPQPSGAEPGADRPPRPVSIWKPRQNDDGSWVFERPAIGPLGDHFADRASFSRNPPDGRFRVCWFGESAAAGYLLAPTYTPAKALAACLGSRVEVLDLARTNEDLRGLAHTAEASLQLSPQAWVIYTGNNWTLLETPDLNPSAPSPHGLRDLARALRAGGIEGAINLARARLTRRVEQCFSYLAKRASEHGLPVVLVIPEVNGFDWDTRQPIPWLPGDRSNRWHRRLEGGLEALRAGDLGAVRLAVEELQALDGGRNPTSHRLLALAQERTDGCHTALRSNRRHVAQEHYPTMGCLGSPRASSFVQDLLRSLADRFGWTVVDLPERFAEFSDRPGNDLFLDYCHLSESGIRIAAEAIAETVRALPAAPRISLKKVPRATSSVRGLAELGAAIHGAHRQLPLDPETSDLPRWIRRALDSSPEIVDTLMDLSEARTHSGPEVLTAAQQRNLHSRHRLSLQHGWRWDHLDFELLAAIQRVLRENRADGEELAARIDRWLIESHAVEKRSRDLSRPPYLWTPIERPFAEAMGRSEGGRRATVRSLWPHQRFGLVSDGSGTIGLRLVARLPEIGGWNGSRRGAVAIFVDEQRIGSAEVSETWSQNTLQIPKDSLRPGAHRLTLRWPNLPTAGDDAWNHALSEMEVGREADLFPIFGEVFELRASASRP